MNSVWRRIEHALLVVHSTSDEDEGEEDEVVEGVEGENCSMELIAEVWIEPQHGIVAKGPPQRAYMENLPYHLLADVVSPSQIQVFLEL